MDPRETQRRMIEAEREIQRDMRTQRRARRAPFWGSGSDEIGKTIGVLIGLALVFGWPLILLLRGLLT
jgi:hypothetical protein